MPPMCRELGESGPCDRVGFREPGITCDEATKNYLGTLYWFSSRSFTRLQPEFR